jgi:hypothetical protein
VDTGSTSEGATPTDDEDKALSADELRICLEHAQDLIDSASAVHAAGKSNIDTIWRRLRLKR